MYSTEDNPAHGISAVKALQLAAAEGQKIWTITQSNLSQAMAALNLSSFVEADIRNAVRAGKEVTAHEDAINFHGRPSAGYMVIDPETGAGGYLIAGGENGGVLTGLGYVISTLTYFYGFISSLAQYAGSRIPLLGQIVQFLEIANFVQSLLANGLKCMNGYEAVAFVMSLFAIITMLVSNLILALVNPLAAFAVGVALDAGFSWLVSQTGNCR
jgi:hypothetical protein